MSTGGFRGAGRELAVAACLVIALAAAAWVLFGPATSGIVVLFSAAIILVALRTLVSRPPTPEDLAESRPDTPATSFAGFWRMQTDIAAAIASLSAWDDNTRRRMQNLLAARLAERHGISLAADPQAARAVFIGDRDSGVKRGSSPSASTARAELWYWIDPQRPTPKDAASRRGIPPRVLTALVHRLEQL
ncbi:MAG TPA: hypothetical protein VN767_27930 [Streptosporangiaceae bacterium]|nr:hypothetical protein [Streptosporangiaceae bacterium]